MGSQREYTSVVFADSEPLGTGHGLTKQEAENLLLDTEKELITHQIATSARASEIVQTIREVLERP